MYLEKGEKQGSFIYSHTLQFSYQGLLVVKLRFFKVIPSFMSMIMQDEKLKPISLLYTIKLREILLQFSRDSLNSKFVKLYHQNIATVPDNTVINDYSRDVSQLIPVCSTSH